MSKKIALVFTSLLFCLPFGVYYLGTLMFCSSLESGLLSLLGIFYVSLIVFIARSDTYQLMGAGRVLAYGLIYNLSFVVVFLLITQVIKGGCS